MSWSPASSSEAYANAPTLHHSFRNNLAVALPLLQGCALRCPNRKIANAAISNRSKITRLNKTMLGPASPWNRFWRDFLEVWGGSEVNFLEVYFRRNPCGNFHTKATSKESRPPSRNFRQNPLKKRFPIASGLI